VVPAPSGRELRLTVRSVDCAGPYFCAAIAGISLQPGNGATATSTSARCR
jgi:hypothetical protein